MLPRWIRCPYGHRLTCWQTGEAFLFLLVPLIEKGKKRNNQASKGRHPVMGTFLMAFAMLFIIPFIYAFFNSFSTKNHASLLNCTFPRAAASRYTTNTTAKNPTPIIEYPTPTISTKTGAVTMPATALSTTTI